MCLIYCTIHCIISIIIGASSNSIIRYIFTINVKRNFFITQLNSYYILPSTLKALCKADILFTHICIIVIGTKDADLCQSIKPSICRRQLSLFVELVAYKTSSKRWVRSLCCSCSSSLLLLLLLLTFLPTSTASAALLAAVHKNFARPTWHAQKAKGHMQKGRQGSRRGGSQGGRETAKQAQSTSPRMRHKVFAALVNLSLSQLALSLSLSPFLCPPPRLPWQDIRRNSIKTRIYFPLTHAKRGSAVASTYCAYAACADSPRSASLAIVIDSLKAAHYSYCPQKPG